MSSRFVCYDVPCRVEMSDKPHRRFRLNDVNCTGNSYSYEVSGTDVEAVLRLRAHGTGSESHVLSGCHQCSRFWKRPSIWCCSFHKKELTAEHVVVVPRPRFVKIFGESNARLVPVPQILEETVY